MPYQTIVTNTSGVERRFPYLPPNGATLLAGESLVINGILDTMITLGKVAALMDEYLADQNLGLITPTYPTGSIAVPGIKYPDADYQIEPGDSNWLFNNMNAPGEIVLLLPPPPLLGTLGEFGFIVGAAQNFIVRATGGAFIRYGDTLSSPNGEMDSDALGAQLWLRVINDTTYIVDRTMGGVDGSWSNPT